MIGGETLQEAKWAKASYRSAVSRMTSLPKFLSSNRSRPLTFCRVNHKVSSEVSSEKGVENGYHIKKRASLFYLSASPL